MSSTHTTTSTRSLGLSALGVLVALAGGALAYLAYQAQASRAINVPSAYEYTVTQDAATAIHYFDSSFYTSGTPSPQNNAYLSQLTDTVDARFTYHFAASKPTQLTTTYSVKAEVQANYPLGGNVDQQSNVWQKEYILTAPTQQATDGTDVTLNPNVTVPYAEYRAATSQLHDALTLPTNSQAVITLSVRTTGTVDGTSFTDARTSSVTMPLDSQIYQPALKFDKTDTKQVVAAGAKEGNERAQKIQLYGGGTLAVAGIALVVYGLRKRIFKTPYQRELDKIYRLHDGIIVRTSRPVDVTDYNVVPMRSFNDMLNLEEELKTPIIADEISSTLTHFMIASGNVLYLYKLTAQSKTERSAPSPAAAEPALQAAAPDHAELKNIRTYGLQTALKAPRTTEGITPKRPLGAHGAPPRGSDLDAVITELSHPPVKKAKKR